MKNILFTNSPPLEKQIMAIYSRHALRAKAYAFLRMKLCPIIESARYVPNSGKIVDLGCGTGIFANILYLESSERKVLGIDRSIKRIEIARDVSKGNSQLEFRVGDVNNISIGECDIITVIDLLHHMPFEEQNRLLGKIYCKLNKGGIFIIKDLQKSPYWKYLFHYFQDSISYRLSRLYFRGAEEMKEVLSDIGFQVKTISLASGYPHPHVLYRCTKSQTQKSPLK